MGKDELGTKMRKKRRGKNGHNNNLRQLHPFLILSLSPHFVPLLSAVIFLASLTSLLSYSLSTTERRTEKKKREKVKERIDQNETMNL